jgi:hypothetical protein
MWSLVFAVVLGTLIEKAVEELIAWCRRRLKKKIEGVSIEDFRSPDVRVRRRAFRKLADNDRNLYGEISPQLEGVLQRLEENQPQQSHRCPDSGTCKLTP